MKRLFREVYNDITDVVLLITLCTLGGFCVGIFLGAAAASGLIVFNALLRILL